jgi:CubicO group peptidase (beta-lactamase class C family)
MTYDVNQARDIHRRTTLDNWSDDPALMHYAFLRFSEFFPQAMIHRDGPVMALDYTLRDDIARFQVDSALGAMALENYVEAAPVNGVVIAQGGRIVFERYPRMRPFDRHLLMSVSKIFVSTVVAILEDRGQIDVRLGIGRYLPALKGSAWDGVSVLDVLDMASGINCPEEGVDDAYSNPDQPYYHFEASLGWLTPTNQTSETPYDYMATLSQGRAPGQAFEYTSVNTFVLSWLAEQILGKPFNEIVRDEIWSRLGAESDAMVSVSRNANAPATHGGISATLRDVLRLGLLFTPSGRAGVAEPVVSDRALDRIHHGGRPDIFMGGSIGPKLTEELGEQPHHNTYQWDFVMEDGDLFKGGYGGQGLYVSPSRDMVVAFVGTPAPDKQENQMTFIARQLSTGIF